MKIIFPLLAIVLFAGVAQAERREYTINEDQLQELRDLVRDLAKKTDGLQDYASRDVMPRASDRADYQRHLEMVENLIGADGIRGWMRDIEGEPSTPTQSLVIPLTQTFLENTDYSSYVESYFNSAAKIASQRCEAWRDQIKNSTAGSVVLAQCSEAKQAKFINGNVAAEVTGQVKLSFPNASQWVQPQTQTSSVSLSTEYQSYVESYFKSTANAATKECEAWLEGVLRQSKGVILYAYCGAPQASKGFNGQLWVTVPGVVGYTYSKKISAMPEIVNQEFVTTTEYDSYVASYVNSAAKKAKANCEKWKTDLVASTSATVVLASCAGPEVIKKDRVHVRYTGKVIILP